MNSDNYVNGLETRIKELSEALANKTTELEQVKRVANELAAQFSELKQAHDYFKNGMAELQDYIDKIEPENVELKAQVEQLRKMAYEKHAVMLMKYGLDGSACKRIYALLEDLMPSQCLAEHDREVAARAVDDAVRNTHTHRIHGEVRLYHCQSALLQYANKIRSGEVEL